MKTLIAVPCFDMVHTDFFQSVVNLQKPANTFFTVVKNTLIHVGRNIIARNAVEAGFDRVVWLDSDMRFPADMLFRLSEDMDKGFDLVTGLYFTRIPPIKPNAFTDIWLADETRNAGAEWLWEYDEGLNPIKACGFGCCITSTDLFKRVGDKFGKLFQPFDGMGEDMSFCIRADEVGAKMVCDTRIKCDHIGQATYNESFYKAQGGRKAVDNNG